MSNGLPQMHWCEECEMDVDVTAGGCCIHCGDQVFGGAPEGANLAEDVKDTYEIPAFLRRGGA